MNVSTVLTVKKIEEKALNNETTIVQLTGWEKCWSQNRKRAQEKFDFEHEKKDGTYFLTHTVKFFLKNYDGKFQEGMQVYVAGRVEEEAWLKDGELRRKLVIVNPDYRILFNPKAQAVVPDTNRQSDSFNYVDDDLPF